MKFTLPRESLLAPLQQVIGVIEKRQTLPILSNVLLRLDEGGLEFTATDLEVELASHVRVDSADSGQVTVPARKLLDICRLLPERCDVAIDCKDDRFAIRCGSGRYSLATLPAENYPEFDRGHPDLEVTIPVPMLRMALEKTTFAMALQDVRYYLNGVLLDLDGLNLRTVASDGHRLAVFEEPLELATDGGRKIIIPRKGVLELLRLLGDFEDAAVRVELGPTTARIRHQDVSFAVKLIEGKFPDYQRVMPRDIARSYTVERELFRSALTRTSVLSAEKYKSLSLTVTEESEMVLQAQTPEHEEAEERLPVGTDGTTISVGFNAIYLLEAVNHIASPEVRLSFPENAKSCLVEDTGDHRFRFIVMPMQL